MPFVRRFVLVWIVGLLVFVAAGCGPAAVPTATPPSSPVAAPTPVSTAAASPASLPAPSPTFTVPATGFAFDAESVVGYYLTRGYTCGDPQPSAQAAGYLFRTCTLVDPDGRTRNVGVVTDPGGNLADGFASVTAKPGESFLEPADALEPLAGFLGAMLGEARGSALLPWLAAHLGDEYAETTAADLQVATYTSKPGDLTTVVVEIANDAYLTSPRPSPS